MAAYSTKSKSSPPIDATPAPHRKEHQRTSTGIAHPTRNVFDAWNSSSTGHQRSENRLAGSASWRDSRNLKLNAQFHGGLAGGERVADTVGAGSENFGKDGRQANGTWAKGAPGLRGKGQKSLWEVIGEKEAGGDGKKEDATRHKADSDEPFEDPMALPPSFQQPKRGFDTDRHSELRVEKQIFQNLCIYINGSTAPLISDHKLKYLLIEHGARMSFALGRRSVTHVIIGKLYDNGGTGGGLAARKIQKEVSRVGGKGIKFVSVDW
jgi:hypothetical protein